MKLHIEIDTATDSSALVEVVLAAIAGKARPKSEPELTAHVSVKPAAAELGETEEKPAPVKRARRAAKVEAPAEPEPEEDTDDEDEPEEAPEPPKRTRRTKAKPAPEPEPEEDDEDEGPAAVLEDDEDEGPAAVLEDDDESAASLSPEELRALGTALLNTNGGREKLAAILKNYGADRLSRVKPEDLDNAVMDIKAATKRGSK